MKPRILRNLILISAASLGLASCTDGYGYGGRVGYGGGYYDGYGGGYGGGYGYGGYGYGDYDGSYYGWNDGWDYPGTGYYVFDSRGLRRRRGDGERRYWGG